jgi:hypothetical protein
MIDTTMINYGMNKLSNAMSAAMPTIGNVSAAYVKFIVTQQIVYLAVAFLTALLCASIWSPIYRKANGKDKNGQDFDEGYFVVASVILGGGFSIAVALMVYLFSDAVLAVTNPEMFTIQTIINAAKSK